MSKRCVIDTNVLLKAVLSDTSFSRFALNHVIKESALLQSSATADEFASVIVRPKFDKYISTAKRTQFRDVIEADATFVEIAETIRVCRDPKDDKFLELAVAGQADYILTDDADLLVLNPFQGIQILTPEEFLQSLN
jgi:putative PIN family toxin of toxin-antitoxin system